MSPGLDKYLVEKYPKIFADRHKNVRETAMCFGFEHQDGWFWLLDQLCKNIQNYIDYNSKRTIIKNKLLRKIVKVLKAYNFKTLGYGNAGSVKWYSKNYILRTFYYHRRNLFNKIIDFIDSKCEKITIETIPQVIATQVKEKYGTLNFYYHGGNEHISGMVWMAESVSGTICEFCGSTDNVGKTSGWVNTICKPCHVNGKENVYRLAWKEIESLSEQRKIKMSKIN